METRVEESTHRTVGEDELGVASNRFGEEVSTKGERESLSSNQSPIEEKEEEVVTVMNSSHCLMVTGKCSISMLSTIMETSEDETEQVLENFTPA